MSILPDDWNGITVNDRNSWGQNPLDSHISPKEGEIWGTQVRASDALHKAYALFMADQNYAGPTTPFLKEKGKWTFYVFPTGEQEEAACYPDEDSARAASWQAYRAWQAKGCRY